MPSALPDGDAAPADGALPSSALDSLGNTAFGVYLHVPFCAVRCGYCDFNTYTATELGGGASQATFARTALSELALARRVLGEDAPPAATVFVGGGTPTLLDPTDLGLLVEGVRATFGLADGAEVTTEANPDSVTAESLKVLRDSGFTRISFGMQSAVPHVLATLDRTHDPERVPRVVQWARAAGLDVSLDLIYGTPGESLGDWEASLRAALACQPDHVSAYALVVEQGTRLATRVRRGEVTMPDDDDEADKYELADAVLTGAGLGWYEVSNWSTSPATRCRHNVGYWAGGDWWGVGPGAHSHVGGVRWWNVKHPSAYADRLAAGVSPAAAREVLDADQQHAERVLLGVRLREGLDLAGLDGPGRRAVAGLVADGLLDGTAAIGGRAVLTRRGRLLADAVVRALLP
ncbi:radical SAM family heme chaperone HemW [Angustibacter luteus]|uniref:Heme chaperone HemW n=1 Tax=Angustibacter luteus TaxID=658456 RepID=A0ABW1JIU5_9ACTN